ncbi:flagellar protein FlgN [Eubacterium sp. MSJ-13]|uniref:flagellar protein FlgN n=1 Tax=Eubacterium sp. MSJ-13 TaxID=2841513 RepID=UPI001C0FDDC7|nr:flagellar protein FlgN [Eubacterium sp. MSJ-13]MBU5477760.1 flagellar protein FlgN [Eubacterium sp. MSJ-13]
MASLMDELLEVLNEEKEIYEELVPISERKTKVLIKEDLKELKEITDKEQLLIDRVSIIDKKREKVTKNISVVLNKDPRQLDLATLGTILCKQPDERKKLNLVHDSLKKIMNRLVIANEQNKELIENSLGMIEFNMNYIKSTRMSPGNNNYDRNAATSYTDPSRGGFDAKQ